MVFFLCISKECWLKVYFLGAKRKVAEIITTRFKYPDESLLSSLVYLAIGSPCVHYCVFSSWMQFCPIFFSSPPFFFFNNIKDFQLNWYFFPVEMFLRTMVNFYSCNDDFEWVSFSHSAIHLAFYYDSSVILQLTLTFWFFCCLNSSNSYFSPSIKELHRILREVEFAASTFICFACHAPPLSNANLAYIVLSLCHLE